MLNLYQVNGLLFWTERDILFRRHCEETLVQAMTETLKTVNPAWEFFRVEAPMLTPNVSINPNYTSEDVFQIEDLTLRPETTMGSYAYARHVLDPYQGRKCRMPVCVWQHGKSFRREQDQVTKNMRLKEFYQLEFQCVYGLTTAADYHTPVVEAVRSTISALVNAPCEIEESDRLPSYSTQTTDVIARGMEVCSISRRTDFEGAHVLEVAVGTDRLIYQRHYRLT
jgi:glycyl-tRNA synthetase